MSFTLGQKVHVEFDGVISYISSDNSKVQVKGDNGLVNSVQAKYVTQLEPASWPPQCGDIWVARGMEYYVRIHSSRNGTVVVEAMDVTSAYYEDGITGLDKFRALSPVLIRRRET